MFRITQEAVVNVRSRAEGSRCGSVGKKWVAGRDSHQADNGTLWDVAGRM